MLLFMLQNCLNRINGDHLIVNTRSAFYTSHYSSLVLVDGIHSHNKPIYLIKKKSPHFFTVDLGGSTIPAQVAASLDWSNLL